MKNEIDQYANFINGEIRFQNVASIDEVTYLPNLVFISNRIAHLIHNQESSPQKFAVMILDINKFREVTSLIGYAPGNQLICEVANRIKSILHNKDFILRLNVAEFAIVIHKFNQEVQLNNIINKIIAVFSEPFQLGERDIYITVSLGVSLYPEHSENPDQLLHFADSAMYRAKKLYHKDYQLYQSEFTVESVEKSELDYSLRSAIKNCELEIYYQPQVVLSSHKMICAEALLRWRHPLIGMVPPDKFIALAEESGLIIEIGDWVLRTAFKKVAFWNSDADVVIKVAINLSPRQFVNNDLVSTIQDLLEETNCKAAWIKLEITESLLLNKGEDIMIILMKLSDMGFELSIDDFGTGYSALSYLTRYPISQIKIDRSFIMDIPLDLEKCELVKIIIQIAKILHLDLVAEGVENQEQVDFLLAHGCQYVQGYFFGRPMPEGDFEKKLNDIRSSLEGLSACPKQVSGTQRVYSVN